MFELWFAWKIVLLQYRKQRFLVLLRCWVCCDLLEKSYFCSIANNLRVWVVKSSWGCDLLEKSYFCSIANNRWVARITLLRVVICLKNRTFAVSQTTTICKFIVEIALWFAWKIVLLQYRKQPQLRPYCWRGCCDLLEKSYFCSIANNFLRNANKSYMVVICLKNRTFAVSQTTFRYLPVSACPLWFAWKIVLLQYRKQLCVPSSPLSRRCDLLEKSYFCSIANNNWKGNKYRHLLWFAWKIVLLQYRKQQPNNEIWYITSCDLLEKSYFCSIANNVRLSVVTLFPVVICLKNRTFAVSQTTAWSKICL